MGVGPITHRKWVLDREPDNLNHIAMVGRCLRGMGDYAGAIAAPYQGTGAVLGVPKCGVWSLPVLPTPLMG